jgi:hypothetical protein
MFYTVGMPVEYREEPCRSALNRVRGMMFEWSLNPYEAVYTEHFLDYGAMGGAERPP